MNILTKIKNHFKSKYEVFLHAPKKQKAIMIIQTFIIVYLLSFTIFIALNNITFTKYVNEYNSSSYKKLQEEISSDKKTVSFQDAIKLINKKNIEVVEFIMSDKDNYTGIKIILKDNFAIQYTSILSYSIANNIEPLLIKENIPYVWTTESHYKNKLSKPIYKKPDLIPPFIKEHLLSILFYAFILYYLSRSMPGLGSKKFEVIFPEKIKGSLNDLVGIDIEIKNEILQLKDIIAKDNIYGAHGLSGVFNIVFSGPAGTGKSRTAMFLAKELDLPMVVGTGNVETGFVGGGAGTIRSLFQEAESLAYNSVHKTAIIFLDEAQALFMKRGNSREKWADDSANELLAQLDGVSSMRELKIIFIAASNFDDSNMVMDEAMERRFQKKIYFRLPGLLERKEILEFYINKIDDSLKGDLNLDYIASITTGLSPAKIETVIKEASFIAIRENAQIDKENKEYLYNNDLDCVKEHVNIDTNMLFKAFERIAIGMTTRDESKVDRKRIILHELGHFICEFDRYNDLPLSEIKEKMKFLKISSESISKVGALGYVLNSVDSEKLRTRIDIEEEIISLYGGYAAESIYFSDGTGDMVSTGAYNDIEKVSKLLKLVIVDMGMYSKSKVNFGVIGLKNDENFVIEIEKLSEELFNKAMSRVVENKELIDFLEGYVFDKWVLGKDELFNLIEEFQKSKSQ